MMMDETLARLKLQLELLDWPSEYLYKFIVPNDSDKVNAVKALFDADADIKSNVSKTGKYISISIKELEISADAIVEKYMQASSISGIISL